MKAGFSTDLLQYSLVRCEISRDTVVLGTGTDLVLLWPQLSTDLMWIGADLAVIWPRSGTDTICGAR